MGGVDVDGTMIGGELVMSRIPLPLDDVPVHAMKQLMSLHLVGGPEPSVSHGLSSSTLPVQGDPSAATGGRSEHPRPFLNHLYLHRKPQIHQVSSPESP
jgi:hypothetical protein